MILGGGKRAFVPNSEHTNGNRLDGVNLIQEWQRLKGNAANAFVEDKAGLDKVDLKSTEYLLGKFN